MYSMQNLNSRTDIIYYPPLDSILLFKSSLIGLFCSPNRGFLKNWVAKLRLALDNGLDNGQGNEDKISNVISHICP